MQISIYLTPRERVALEKRAAAENTSLSYVIRLALRRELGLPVKSTGNVNTSKHTQTLVREPEVR